MKNVIDPIVILGAAGSPLGGFQGDLAAAGASLETAGLAERLRTYLVEAVGETFVGTLHPFVVSPRTPEQVKAVLSLCAYHRVGLSVVCERPVSDGDDVDVVLTLDALTCPVVNLC